MKTLCDSCESAAAIVFCAADEAALCSSCDEKVHLCNKLASRHVRVGLASPSDVLSCDICEHAPAFFYCEIDGTSLCLQCDMIVHVGGKRTHARYLLFRQRVEFPDDKPGGLDEPGHANGLNDQQNQSIRMKEADQCNTNGKIDKKLIDLNCKPQKVHGQTSTTQLP